MWFSCVDLLQMLNMPKGTYNKQSCSPATVTLGCRVPMGRVVGIMQFSIRRLYRTQDINKLLYDNLTTAAGTAYVAVRFARRVGYSGVACTWSKIVPCTGIAAQPRSPWPPRLAMGLHRRRLRRAALKRNFNTDYASRHCLGINYRVRYPNYLPTPRECAIHQEAEDKVIVCVSALEISTCFV